MAKIFKCKGIPYYITGCSTKVMATIVAFKNRWGVTPGDLIEVEKCYYSKCRNSFSFEDEYV